MNRKTTLWIKDLLIEQHKDHIVSLKEHIAIQNELIDNFFDLMDVYQSMFSTDPNTVPPSIKTVVRRAKKSLQHVVTCAYCGKTGTHQLGPDFRSWHIDHIEPKSLGGSDDPTNLVKSCASCNMKKGSTRMLPLQGTITAGLTEVKVDG